MAKNHTIVMLGIGKPKGLPPTLGDKSEMHSEAEKEYGPSESKMPMNKMGRMGKMAEPDEETVCAHTKICPFYKSSGEMCGGEEE